MSWETWISYLAGSDPHDAAENLVVEIIPRYTWQITQVYSDPATVLTPWPANSGKVAAKSRWCQQGRSLQIWLNAQRIPAEQVMEKQCWGKPFFPQAIWKWGASSPWESFPALFPIVSSIFVVPCWSGSMFSYPEMNDVLSFARASETGSIWAKDLHSSAEKLNMERLIDYCICRKNLRKYWLYAFLHAYFHMNTTRSASMT